MSVISGVVGASAAKSSARTQAGAAETAAETAAATQLEMFEKGAELTAPWRKVGEEALGTLQEKIADGPGEFEASPGYDFRVSEGQKAIERSASARGGVLSGAAGKALTRFGQDYATSDYDNFLRRYYEELTPLQSLAGVGQSTASQTAGQAGATGAGVANTQLRGGLAAGEALAGGEINRANAITGAMQSGTSNALLAYDQYNKYKTGAAAATATNAVASNVGRSESFELAKLLA